MATRTVTFQELRDALLLLPKDGRNTRARYGQACLYTSCTGEHCAIGAALAVLNLPVPTPGSGVNGIPVYATEFKEWTQSHGFVFTPEAEVYATAVQDVADDCDTIWEAAIDSADFLTRDPT